MEDALLQLGVGGILAVLIIKEVLNWAKPLLDKRNNGKDKEEGKTPDCRVCKDCLDKIASQVGELHSWHNVRNADGGFVWYVPSAFERAIEKLAENIAILTNVIRDRDVYQQESIKALERLERRLEQ